MIQFLKNAIREFKHVVWPTRKETQKFFSLVLMILVFFGIYLFIVSNIFSELVFGLKNILGPNTQSSNINSMSQEEIDALFSNEAQIDATSVEGSGATIEIVDDKTITESSATGQTAE